MDVFAMDSYGSYGDQEVFSSSDDLTALRGDGNSPPLQADTTTQRSPSLVELLGSIGQTARDFGTAVGMTKRELSTVDDKFKQARDAQAKDASGLSTWWLYTSTTDKVMIGLAAAGLLLVVWKGGK